MAPWRDVRSASTSRSAGRSIRLAGLTDDQWWATIEPYLSTPWSNRFSLQADAINLAAVYKRLGELYEERGDRAKSASYAAKFVELWKDADPELQPKVREARALVVRLGDPERR